MLEECQGQGQPLPSRRIGDQVIRKCVEDGEGGWANRIPNQVVVAGSATVVSTGPDNVTTITVLPNLSEAFGTFLTCVQT
jgi:hypothetical protein